jgi:replicative DNA helicase
MTAKPYFPSAPLAAKLPMSNLFRDEADIEPPHNIEAEQALLGAIMVDNREVDSVADVVKPDDFYDPLHGKIYDAISNFASSGKQANPVTLKTFFQNEEPIPTGTGPLTIPAYLGRLVSCSTAVINARDYAQTVADLSVRRKVIELADHVRAVAQNAPVDANPVDQIDGFTRSLLDLQAGGSAGSFCHVSEGLRELHRRLVKNTEPGIETGYPSLDRIIGGLHKRRLIIIGARPKQGKTALIQSMIYNLVVKEVPTCFFSLELGRDEINLRFVSMITGIPYDQLSNGTYDRGRIGDIRAAFKAISTWPLYIDTLPSRTTSALASRTRNAVKRHGVAAVFVDYIQKLTIDKRFNGRYDEMTRVCLDLEDVKKDQGIPLIAAAQLSRRSVQTATVQKDFEKFNPEAYRPTDTDLRDSGQLEQSADQLLLLHRPEFFLKKLKPLNENHIMDWEVEMSKYKGKAELITYFNRHGSDGDTQLSFHGPTMRFDELSSIYNA